MVQTSGLETNWNKNYEFLEKLLLLDSAPIKKLSMKKAAFQTVIGSCQK